MSTKMNEADWDLALEVFRACLPARGAKARDDRLFLEALHHFTIHNITWRALPERYGNWNSVWKRFDPLPGSACLHTREGARQIRCVRRLFRDAGRAERDGASGADVRQHRDPRACLCGWSKRGRADQALGRSRPSRRSHANACRATGGFGTKIHLKTDHDGLPIAFELTGGEAADSPLFAALIDAGPDEAPRAVVCNKGYDSDANRAMARERGAVPIIPHRSNRKTIPTRFAAALYRGRARIEQMIGKLKRFKRVALRCEKTARNFRSIVALAAAFILVKSVHTA